MLDAQTYHTATFDHDVRASMFTWGSIYSPRRVALSWSATEQRTIVDLIQDDELKADAAGYAAIERLEIAVCDRSPYRDIGRSWQSVARRRWAHCYSSEWVCLTVVPFRDSRKGIGYRGTTVTGQRIPDARPSRPSAVSSVQPRCSARAT